MNRTHYRQTHLTCPECDRVFDMTNTTDASEWFYGHDCESEVKRYDHHHFRDAR